jgi:hypothetical protein
MGDGCDNITNPGCWRTLLPVDHLSPGSDRLTALGQDAPDARRGSAGQPPVADADDWGWYNLATVGAGLGYAVAVAANAAVKNEGLDPQANVAGFAGGKPEDRLLLISGLLDAAAAPAYRGFAYRFKDRNTITGEVLDISFGGVGAVTLVAGILDENRTVTYIAWRVFLDAALHLGDTATEGNSRVARVETWQTPVAGAVWGILAFACPSGNVSAPDLDNESNYVPADKELGDDENHDSGQDPGTPRFGARTCTDAQLIFSSYAIDGLWKLVFPTDE